MKFGPEAGVTERRALACLAACHGFMLYAIVAYADVHVPTRWARARRRMKALSPCKSEFMTNL